MTLSADLAELAANFEDFNLEELGDRLDRLAEQAREAESTTSSAPLMSRVRVLEIGLESMIELCNRREELDGYNARILARSVRDILAATLKDSRSD